MKFISHRGNIDGIKKSEENNPNKIDFCLRTGYDVEVDVWYINDKFYLGHDEPQYEIKIDYLINEKLWCHAKNKDSLEILLKNNIHCFWHQNDGYTLTSKGIIWVYPNIELPTNSVAVMPEIANYSLYHLSKCYGICSDNIKYYKDLL